MSGEPRSTLDVDLVVELSEKDIEPLIAALGDRFHVDSDDLRRAVRERSSTNVIHYATSSGLLDHLAHARRGDEIGRQGLTGFAGCQGQTGLG